MVTILIPNRNEPQIDRTVGRLRTLGVPIVVSNDPTGKGIGWAIRQGLQDVHTDWVLIAMADGSEDVGSLRYMIDEADTTVYPCVWGDRWKTGTVEGYPEVKRLFNRLGNWLIAVSTQRIPYAWYADWTDLAKAYRTDLLRTIDWSDDFRAEVEMPVRFHRRYLLKGEAMPIVHMHWRERAEGTSSYRISHAVKCLLTLGKLVVWG